MQAAIRMSPEQCRAARAWLGWTQADLASEARVGLSTVKDFESADRETIDATLAQMQQALERAGVAFRIDGFTVTQPPLLPTLVISFAPVRHQGRGFAGKKKIHTGNYRQGVLQWRTELIPVGDDTFDIHIDLTSRKLKPETRVEIDIHGHDLAGSGQPAVVHRCEGVLRKIGNQVQADIELPAAKIGRFMPNEAEVRIVE